MDKLDIFKTPIYYSEYTFDNLRRVRSYVKDLEGKNVARNLKQKHGKILFVDRYKYMPSDLLDFISYLKECISKLKSDYKIKNIVQIKDIYFTKDNPNLDGIYLSDTDSIFKGYYFFDVHNDFKLRFKNSSKIVNQSRHVRVTENNPYNGLSYYVGAENSLFVIIPAWIEIQKDIVYNNQYVLNFNIEIIK
jgi:hypothetical protein|tara:strand:- start:145 stop:717 length:573 start_codon:yes stop_codon:yes gene_type:complete